MKKFWVNHSFLLFVKLKIERPFHFPSREYNLTVLSCFFHPPLNHFFFFFMIMSFSQNHIETMSKKITHDVWRESLARNKSAAIWFPLISFISPCFLLRKEEVSCCTFFFEKHFGGFNLLILDFFEQTKK